MTTIQSEEYTEPFSGIERVQFSDTDERDSRFIRADKDAVIEVPNL
ncbi:MAG: hypothetical protein J07AB43_00440 [Candidatus Nanosalina sp. J07AB43]|nr:MAG: hypothetical protein J07AB43_00440 [Candidatus Nanosalina sp. J07AB43]